MTYLTERCAYIVRCHKIVSASIKLFEITKRENSIPFGTEKNSFKLKRVLFLDMEHVRKGSCRFRTPCRAHFGLCLLKFMGKISILYGT